MRYATLKTMKVLDLFSGIGGFSLGLERAGMHTVAFCEQNEFCQAIIKKHWPGIKLYEDVRTLTKSQLDADGITVDVICGGFPCQDISVAGKQAG
jgi:DNA (cytosine-5)-methyltransferase 1